MTNQPVRFLGRHPIGRIPILSLAFIQARAQFDCERDLSQEPTLLSGGDRKAQGKARAAQSSLLNTPRRIARNWWLAAYGSLACVCPRCRHTMLLDELDTETIACDRCKKVF